MKRLARMSVSGITALCATAALAAPVGGPPERPKDDGANIALTLIVGQKGGPSGGYEKTYRMLGQDGTISRMLMGWRAPIPTRHAGEDTEEAAETSFVYQNVGVSADLGTTILDDGRVLVHGTVEISGPRGAQLGEMLSGKPTLIGTFQQALRVVLQKGKRLRVAEAPDPEGGTLFLDIQADPLE
jgi:hypothetical protein